MIHKRSRKRTREIGGTRNSARRRLPFHRGLFIEPLESRQLLSVTLSSIGDQSVYAGAPLNVALDGESENPLSYTVEVSNANLTATVSEDNPSIRIAIDDDANDIHGNVTIQLFEDLVPETVDRIMALIDSGYYDGLTFHRIIDDFMIQGGDPDGDGTGGPGFQFDDEFTSELQFTSAGLLAMANSGSDTNGSQIFITVTKTRWLDFQHTIFGMVTEGQDIVEQLGEVSVDGSYAPLSDVVMTTVTVVDDAEDAVLRLSASNGVTGTADVTVTVIDTVTSETTSETFQVTFVADTTNNLPYLEKIDPIVTSVNTPVTVVIPAVDVEEDAMQFAAAIDPYTPNLTYSINSSTGALTVTPSNGVYGVFSILVGVSNSTGDRWDLQYVPVYVIPPSPTGIALASASDTGASDSDALTNLNNSAGQALEFEIEGVIIGALVELYADGELISQTTAVATTVTIVTDGTATLADGTHQFAVKQTLLDEAVEVGNLETTVDLESGLSTPLTVTIDTVQPVIASNPVTTAYEEGTYIYQVSAEDDGDVQFSLSDAPTGMTIDPDTGMIAWSPVAAGTVVPVTVRATDTAGNVTSQSFNIEVKSASGSISGFVYVDADNDGLRVTPGGQSHLAMQGVVVRLLAADGQGNWTQLSSVSTGSDGSYSFDNLTPGTYRMQEVQPAGYLDGKETLGTIGGAVRGAVAQDQFEIQLGANENAVEYNFGERGLLPGSISLRLCLASAPAMPQNVTPADTDQTPPAGYSITVADGLIGASEAATAGFTFAGAEVGTTYKYTVAGSGGAGTVSGTGTIVSATQQVANIDVSALPDGALTFSVTLTDAMGNTGFAATAAATLDQTAPAGYSVGLSDNALDETEASSTFFQISGGEVGATYSYTVTSDGGAGSVTGGGTVQSTAQVVSGIDVSGLPDGTLTFSVALTDAAGNTGAAATAAATLDQNVPVGYSITTDDDLIGAAEAATTSFTFAGAELGTTFNYTVTSSGGDGAVTGTGTITSANQQIMGIDVSNLPDGILTFSVALTDAGNKTGAAVTAAAMLDKTAPAGYTIAAYDAIDADTAADTGFLIIDAEPFTTYAYTITSDGGDGSVTGSGMVTLFEYFVSGIDVSSLPDGLLTISVTLTDDAGNVGAAATDTATLDQSGS